MVRRCVKAEPQQKEKRCGRELLGSIAECRPDQGRTLTCAISGLELL